MTTGFYCVGLLLWRGCMTYCEADRGLLLCKRRCTVDVIKYLSLSGGVWSAVRWSVSGDVGRPQPGRAAASRCSSHWRQSQISVQTGAGQIRYDLSPMWTGNTPVSHWRQNSSHGSSVVTPARYWSYLSQVQTHQHVCNTCNILTNHRPVIKFRMNMFISKQVFGVLVQ